MTHFSKLTMPLMLCTVLAGCGLSDTLGFSKSSPDEFNVVTRPPLVLPPEYNLRPVNSKDRRPAQPSGADLARIITLGETNRPQDIDAAEQAILEKASDGQAYGDGIRETLENERTGTASEPTATTNVLVQNAAPTAQ
jgi:hypothetical protein